MWPWPRVDDIDIGSATVEEVQPHTSDGLKLEGSYAHRPARLTRFGDELTE
jgi:hypothetical protein